MGHVLECPVYLIIINSCLCDRDIFTSGWRHRPKPQPTTSSSTCSPCAIRSLLKSILILTMFCCCRATTTSCSVADQRRGGGRPVRAQFRGRDREPINATAVVSRQSGRHFYVSSGQYAYCEAQREQLRTGHAT